MSELPRATHTLTVDGDALPLLEQEWLLTNGTGAFAMGTALGCPTRRYHGLLVAAAHPPVRRLVTLNQVWERLVMYQDDAPTAQPLEFSTLQFRTSHDQHVFAPRGHEMLQRFDRGLSVRWTYAWGRVGFERELFLHWKEQAATLRYRVTGLDDAHARATLHLAPMLTLRDYHGLLHRAATPAFEVHPRIDPRDRQLTLRRAQHALTLRLHGPFDVRFERDEHWWHNVFYRIDAERGQEDHEDYFVPGHFALDLPAGAAEAEVLLTVALGETAAEPRPDTHRRAAHLMPVVNRLHAILTDAPAQPAPPVGGKAKRAPREETTTDLPTLLAVAADDFVVDRVLGGQKLSTIIAGYPWFSDWGRDTFIALPGLLLDTGRTDEARAVLRTFAEAIHQGLVPNRFDDYDETAAHYNTVDASLWYIHAARAYHAATGDDATWRTWLADACVSIIEAYIRGTGQGPDGRPLIQMDEDGLIAAGTPHTQLTWMDAACGKVVFTPRPGKAVEINALWYNALLELADTLPRAHAAAAKRYRQLAQQVRPSFQQVFWSDELGYLIDHVWAGDQGAAAYADTSVRPNQVFAAALPQSPLTAAQRKRVIRVVADRLLTPVGLRTLPPEDRAYHGRYTGAQPCRDEAYHQGTIWPWLIGPYAEALLRQGDFSAKARREAMAAIRPLLDVLREPTEVGPIGQVPEVYEADMTPAPVTGTPRHRPVGCMAQAWSIAEVLRIWALLHRPD